MSAELQWELRFNTRRQGGNPATEASLMAGNGELSARTQVAGALFTIECLDILLADPTVTQIKLTALARPDPVPFDRDNGVAVPA